MRLSLAFIGIMATAFAAQAQSTDPAQQTPSAPQSQPAPIVRSYPGLPPGVGYAQRGAAARPIFDMQPAAGVTVRGDVNHGVQTVATSENVTELRILQGRADVTVHHPANHSQILVDLPGGQISLLKDGFYTFNAETNTTRVLRGEAEAYTGPDTKTKGTKIKETQQLTLFANAKLKAVNAAPYELTADLVGGGNRGDGNAPNYRGYSPYGNGFYGGYPYYAYGYPYGYYPYGFGYPFGFGVGFGYYGGFGGRGFRR